MVDYFDWRFGHCGLFLGYLRPSSTLLADSLLGFLLLVERHHLDLFELFSH
jgi:hypothetical protein